MRLYKYFLAGFNLLFLLSCAKEKTENWQLKEQVLSYYRDSVPNRDKYRAALFLLENMDVHYSPRNEAIDSFYAFMDSITGYLCKVTDIIVACMIKPMKGLVGIWQ